jgi:DNA-binding CsgD family transcriptional regulator
VQRKILELIRENPKITDKEIAVKLGSQTKTISNALPPIRKKANAKNRKELAAKLPPPSNPT